MNTFSTLNACAFVGLVEGQTFPYRSFDEGTTASLSATPANPGLLPRLDVVLVISPTMLEDHLDYVAARAAVAEPDGRVSYDELRKELGLD